MEIKDSLQLLLGIGTVVVTGAWVYLVRCVSEITKAYQARSELATREADYYAKRLDRMAPLIESWERSLERIGRELAASEITLGERTAERDALNSKVSDLKHLLHQVRASKDPLARLVPHDIESQPW